MPSRRRALLASLAAGTASLAGCSVFSGSPDPDEPPDAGVAVTPDPEGHVFGANGEWSSFGCNAANTREVGDGDAPVDGVSERWREPVAQIAYHAPVVAGGRVFVLDPDELRVLDAADGAELWTAPEVDAVPLVREGVVYATTGDAIRALDAETSDQLWERRPGEPGRVTQPATYAGDELVCAAGERVLSLDPANGDVQWARDVFGQVLDHAAFFSGHWRVVATEAGLVYALGDDGIGGWRWQLPAPPTAPPSAGTDSIYVPCRDGTTYALFGEQTDGHDVHWTADTGWAERGLAVVDDLVVAAAGNRLQALDAESGDRHWETEIGDWRHTAPAFGRDTVFVGGDRLRAFDPTPGDSPDGGPALRFEREFAGRVGPGPVIDDGTLYVVAEVESEAYALLALE